jgi:tetratricopeptide (TPR) repeat protein
MVNDQKPPEDTAPPWFGELSQVDFEIDFYQRLLARDCNNVSVLRSLGELLACKGLYARSLEIDRRLVELVPHDCIAHYNLACSLAMQGSIDDAVEQLQLAIDAGYDDFGHLELDSDLDALRTHPQFVALMRRHRMIV